MKLISARNPMPSELKHAFSAEEAVILVKHRLDTLQTIDGLKYLRGFLALDFEFEVFNKIRNGEWLLIKPEAYCFDYAQFKDQMFQRNVMALMASPPPQIKIPMKILRVVASETDELLASRRYIAIIDGERGVRSFDELGIGQIPEPTQGSEISLRVILN